MNEHELAAVLRGLIEGDEVDAEEAREEVRRVESFGDAGVMTAGAGLVVRCRDGREFQVTVVRSR
jgi:phage gp45-like